MKSKSIAKKLLATIKKRMKRIEKRGYSFDLPKELLGLTKKGSEKQKYTKKELEYLSSIRAKDLYKYATFKTDEGELLKGEEARKRERSIAGKKGYERRRIREEYEKIDYDTQIETDYGGYIDTDNEFYDEYKISDIIHQGIIDEFFSEDNFRNLSNNGYMDLMSEVRNIESRYGTEAFADAIIALRQNTNDILLETWKVYDQILYVYIDELNNFISSWFSIDTPFKKYEDRTDTVSIEYGGERFNEYFK